MKKALLAVALVMSALVVHASAGAEATTYSTEFTRTFHDCTFDFVYKDAINAPATGKPQAGIKIDETSQPSAGDCFVIYVEVLYDVAPLASPTQWEQSTTREFDPYYKTLGTYVHATAPNVADKATGIAAYFGQEGYGCLGFYTYDGDGYPNGPSGTLSPSCS